LTVVPARGFSGRTMAATQVTSCAMITGLRTYGVSKAARQPLLDFMLRALREQECRIIYCSEARTAPFVVTFELSTGERMGIVAYAFWPHAPPPRTAHLMSAPSR
jgi:hypothetical protein